MNTTSALPHPESQKQIAERVLFDEFQRVSPHLILNEIAQPKPPAPDILGKRDDRRVGVEITRFIRDPEKRQESEQDRCLKIAHEEYRATGFPEVSVSVCWAIPKPILRPALVGLAKMLCNFVSSNLPPVGGYGQREPAWPSPLAEHVDFVSIERIKYEGPRRWNCIRAGWFPTLGPDELRATLATKEPKVTAYRAFCDDLWLLIASEGDPSSFVEVSDSAIKEQYVTGFDRVFFLNSVPRETIELAVRLPDLSPSLLPAGRM